MTLTTEELATLKSYSEIAKRWDEIDPPKQRDDDLQRFTSMLPQKAVVLDVGCGSARDANFFLRFQFNYLGIDFCLPMLREARSQTEANLCAMNLRELGIKKESVDGFIALTTLMHIPSKLLPNALNEISRTLKMNSVGLIAIPEGDFDGYFNGRHGESPPCYCKAWELEDFLAHLHNAGFEVIWYISYEHAQMLEIVVKKVRTA